MRRLAVGSCLMIICALLVVQPAAAGGGGAGCEHGESFTDARTTEVSMVDLCFTPNVAACRPRRRRHVRQRRPACSTSSGAFTTLSATNTRS